MAFITYIEHHYNHNIYTVYLVENYITVIVTASASVVKRWISSTLYFNHYFVDQECLVVGLGVQWTPGGHNTPPDMLQLCVDRRFLIFHLAHADYVPESGSPNRPTPTTNAAQKRFLARPSMNEEKKKPRPKVDTALHD
ncbi:hypothetical protein JHK84_050249 [Glycine max]|nr:hypothetical protein JHK86_050191 [Glycine max]KAG5094661.1 hypothetical protein JHK84_050249 [Glycine max]